MTKHPPPAGGTLFTKEGKEKSYAGALFGKEGGTKPESGE